MNKGVFFGILSLVLIGIAGAYVFIVPEDTKTELGKQITKLFPDGENIPKNEGGAALEDDEKEERQDTRFREIFDRPVSGFTILEKSGATIIRFIEKETGHVYDHNIETSDQRKVSNKTMPGIEEVIWNESGNSFIVRFEKNGRPTQTLLSFDEKSSENNLFPFSKKLTIGTQNEDVRFLQITLNADSDTRVSETGVGSPGQESTFFGEKTKNAVIRFQQKYDDETFKKDGLSLPDGVVDGSTLAHVSQVNKALFDGDPEVDEVRISEKTLPEIISITSNKNRILFTEKEPDGGASGFESAFDGTQKRRVFQAPISELALKWPKEGGILIFPKPTAWGDGFLYQIENSSLRKTIGPMRGLSALPNRTGDAIFVSASFEKEGFHSFLYDTTGKKFAPITPKTLAEKCVWSFKNQSMLFCAAPKSAPKATYPDDWYRGKVNFEDRFWIIDTENDRATILFDKAQENLYLSPDAVSLALDNEERFLFFIDRKNLSLWSLRVGN